MVAQSGGQGSLIGATIGGYKVEALIGRGAMGAVYLGRDVKLNRLVALKVLLGSLAKTKSQVEEFLQEAQTAAPLHHPGIVRIYSAGIEDGTPYIAMEFVNGEPLDRFLKRKGRLKWEVALQIARKLAGALHAAHKAGIVHRDIKPSNIMLDQKGGVRLTDFGIAKMQSDENDSSQSQSFLGTPQYMSPEQAKGEGTTTSSDLYSLGVTLYEMIGGELPFTGESPMALINSICNDTAPRLNELNSEVPDDVARFVAYLMGKTPKERPANAKVAYGMAERLQKQKGELSSVSDSLTGFIQDAMEVRPFQSVHESKGKPELPESADEARARREGYRTLAIRVGRVAAVLFSGIIAFGVGTQVSGTSTIDLTREVPGHDVIEERRLDGGARLLQLSSSTHGFADIRWIGDESTLWITTRGRQGMLAQDAIGALGYDMNVGSGFTLAEPHGAALRHDSDPVYMNGLEHVRIISTQDDHPFAHQFLMPGSDPKSGDVVIVSRHWNRTTPDPHVLLRVDREHWVWRSSEDPLREHFGQAVMHPDGMSIACILYDPQLQRSYIVEQALNEVGEWTQGSERTTSEMHIKPGSLQYTVDGKSLLYLRSNTNVTSASDAELWILRTNDTEINGRRLYRDVHGDRYAINPEGDIVAVQIRPSQDSEHTEVVLIRSQNGTEIGNLGNGTLGENAFHPVAPYIVINRRSLESEAQQLVAIHLDDLDRRFELTNRPAGMRDAYAFSHDGRYLASISRRTTTSSAVVIHWSEQLAASQ